MPEVDTPNNGEREFETGTDESFKGTNVTGAQVHNENQRVMYGNLKRTYDVYQDLDLATARQALIEQTRLNQIASQAVQNAVETANMLAKRNIEYTNLAHDSYWNPVSSGAGMNLTAGAVPANRAVDVAAAGTGVSAEAVSATVAKQLDATITPVLAVLQQLVQGIAAMNASMANVVAQSQPKAPTAPPA